MTPTATMTTPKAALNPLSAGGTRRWRHALSVGMFPAGASVRERVMPCTPDDVEHRPGTQAARHRLRSPARSRGRP